MSAPPRALATSLPLLAALLISLTALPAPAAPGGPPPPGPWEPENGLTLGPSAAWVGGGELGHAFAAGGELTYYHVINTPLAFWLSGGARLWTDGDETPVLPYGEVGLSFMLLVVGAGYSAGLGSEQVPTHAVHGFFGLAIPLWFPVPGQFMYIEPYYRPAWDVSGEGHPASHELGLMLKWFFDLGC